MHDGRRGVRDGPVRPQYGVVQQAAANVDPDVQVRLTPLVLCLCHHLRTTCYLVLMLL
jgi:hypothetical protein